MQLFLLRHAEAESEAASDEMRTLTAKGSGKPRVSASFVCGTVSSRR